MTTSSLDRRLFDALLGALLSVTAAFLLIHPEGELPQSDEPGANRNDPPEVSKNSNPKRPKMGLGIGLSGIVGYVSSLLGIGGGIVHVPLLVRVVGFDVHVATATSHLILAITALSGILVHVIGGAFHRGLVRTALLAIGVIVGAQLGAKASLIVHGRWIVRSLAVALGLVGIRLLMIGLKGFVE